MTLADIKNPGQNYQGRVPETAGIGLIRLSLAGAQDQCMTGR
jgi:hypothetical protein